METYKRIVKSAQQNHGIMLAPLEARSIAIMIQQMDQQLGAALTAVRGADELLNAYVEEYGSDLFDRLTAEAEEIVEAEVVDEPTIPFEEGPDSEDDRVDASSEEEE